MPVQAVQRIPGRPTSTRDDLVAALPTTPRRPQRLDDRALQQHGQLPAPVPRTRADTLVNVTLSPTPSAARATTVGTKDSHRVGTDTHSNAGGVRGLRSVGDLSTIANRVRPPGARQ